MADDIEWITMLDFPIRDHGPQHVAEGMLIPLVAEWDSFTLSPTEFISDGVTVVSLGRFTCTQKTTGKHADADYAHIWNVNNGKIARFRQYIDTFAITQARD